LSRRRGQSIVYVIMLMPLLILIFSLAVDVASLQLQKLRLRYAVDLATLTAATAVDAVSYTRNGQLQLDTSLATMTAREYLFRNLAGLPEIPDPEAVVAAADITIINQTPAFNPYTGRGLDRPSVCARIRVPYKLSLLGWFGLRTLELTVAADSEIRP
jgi:putative Flp pilus-assembly TadE/G-like protein